MIPILFATAIEGMFKQLPQIDFTFGIGDIVGSIALLVSAFTFYISYTQASQSEQIKTSRDIWASIDEKFEKVRKTLKEIDEKLEKESDSTVTPEELWEMFKPLLVEIDYFAYLILTGEIKDKVVLNYYRRKLNLILIKTIGIYFPLTKKEIRDDIAVDYRFIYSLLQKWDLTDVKDDT